MRDLHINNSFCRFKVRRKLAITTTRQWDIPHSAKYKLKNASKHKAKLFADKGAVQFLDSLKKLTEGFSVQCIIVTFSVITLEEPCGGAG